MSETSSLYRSATLSFLAVTLFVACPSSKSKEKTTQTIAATDATPPELPAVSLPSPAGELAPAMTAREGTGEVDGEHLMDVEICGSCHPDVFAQQQASAHALSSFNNPVYRFAIDKFRDAIGNTQSQMCGSCHDISLLIDNAMPGEISPTDDRAHAGVTCRVCHGITSATNDGNGSYTLSREEIPLPISGNAASVEIHRQGAKPIDHEALCGSCHRSFLNEATGNDHFLAGMDDLSDWKSSAYNLSGLGRVDDAIPRTSCVGCHMKPERAHLGDVAADSSGNVSSHRFLGGHTWMASMQNDATQLARQQEFLRDSMTVDIAAAFDHEGKWTRPAEGAPVTPGQKLGVDVVIRNVGVGHKFPAGVRDAVDSWLEFTVADSQGKELLVSGDTPRAHRLRVLVGNKDAEPQLARNTFDFYEVIVDHTIAARDARVVRYSFKVPENLAAQRLPLRIGVRLLHRTRNLVVQEKACEAFNSKRGKAFAAHQEFLDKPVLNPCPEQPISVVAETNTWVGKGADKRLKKGQLRVEWKRLYEHALGLLPEMPREATVAKHSLEQALKAVEISANPRDKAKVLAAMGAVYAGAPCGPSAPDGWPSCQARLDQGLEWLAKAEELVPKHPAIARARARLYDRSFRWPEVAKELSDAAERAPQNSGVWRDLSKVLSIVGEHQAALQAAQQGLSLLPRDDDMLRIQSISMKKQQKPAKLIEAAAKAYTAHTRDGSDRPTQIRGRCAAKLSECEQERLSVHTHELSDPPPAPGGGSAPPPEPAPKK